MDETDRQGRAVHPLAQSPLSDAEVAQRVLAGEINLFEIVIRRTNEGLYRAVRSILRDEADVEDVMQETYAAAYSHLDQFSGRAKFSTWAIRIGINAALAHMRKRGRVVNLEEPQDDVAAEERTPERLISTKLAAAELVTAIDALPDSLRVVLMLRGVEGLSTEETSDVLGLREEAVKVRFHRARAHLRKQFGDRLPELIGEFLFERSRCDRVAEAMLFRLRQSTH